MVIPSRYIVESWIQLDISQDIRKRLQCQVLRQCGQAEKIVTSLKPSAKLSSQMYAADTVHE